MTIPAASREPFGIEKVFTTAFDVMDLGGFTVATTRPDFAPGIIAEVLLP